MDPETFKTKYQVTKKCPSSIMRGMQKLSFSLCFFFFRWKCPQKMIRLYSHVWLASEALRFPINPNSLVAGIDIFIYCFLTRDPQYWQIFVPRSVSNLLNLINRVFYFEWRIIQLHIMINDIFGFLG